MKKFIYISLFVCLCFVVTCCSLMKYGSKPMVYNSPLPDEAMSDSTAGVPKPSNPSNSDEAATAGAEPTDEPKEVVLTSGEVWNGETGSSDTGLGSGEGIGLGNPNTIGHGAGFPESPNEPEFISSSPEINLIEVDNTKVVKPSADLSEGRVVYYIPEKMKVRSTYKVTVRIAKSKSVVSMLDSLKGTVMTSVIPVTSTMEVKLVDISPSDNKAFEIVDGNSGEQIVEEGDTYTEWSWDVTPLKVGNSKLKIVVSVIRNNNKKDVVYEDTVEVEKDVTTQIGFFLKKYWQWILSTIAIPFIIWIWKSRKKKKGEAVD